jgi:hypothetical protein
MYSIGRRGMFLRRSLLCAASRRGWRDGSRCGRGRTGWRLRRARWLGNCGLRCRVRGAVHGMCAATRVRPEWKAAEKGTNDFGQRMGSAWSRSCDTNCRHMRGCFLSSALALSFHCFGRTLISVLHDPRLVLLSISPCVTDHFKLELSENSTQLIIYVRTMAPNPSSLQLRKSFLFWDRYTVHHIEVRLYPIADLPHA